MKTINAAKVAVAAAIAGAVFTAIEGNWQAAGWALMTAFWGAYAVRAELRAERKEVDRE